MDTDRIVAAILAAALALKKPSPVKPVEIIAIYHSVVGELERAGRRPPPR